MTISELGLITAAGARTAIIFVLLVAAIRITGKRQMGEMNLHDLLLVMIMANSVQNAMTKGDGRLGVALVSGGTLIVLGWLLQTLIGRHESWEHLLMGVPTVIVENGRMIRGSMRREGVTEEEVLAAVRDQGLPDLARVRLAVLENNGTVSVIPEKQPPAE
jgi:uncharacterized membrane protein YcaP (DUF421 family)